MSEHQDSIGSAIPLLLVSAVFVYSILSGWLDRARVSAPMVFVAFGVLIGESGFGLVRVDPGAHWLLTAAELTLALLLFSDASHLRLRDVEGDSGPPARLLLIGLPLTLAAGTLLAFWLFPEHGWVVAALLAALLAPTDAALGAVVVSDIRVPGRIRRMLNVESGLNDGLATPVVTVLITVVASEAGLLGDRSWLGEAAWGLAAAVVAAVVVGGGGGWVLRWCRGRGWTSPFSEQVVVLTLALLSYLAAVAVHGNGFVAAFLGGMIFGFVARTEMPAGTEFTETAGLLASYVVWMAFGAAMVGPALADTTVRTTVMAVAALTVIRMVPVAVAMTGRHWGRPTILFVGWFGPRGLATVIFTIIALQELGSTSVSEQLVEVASITVVLSILAHGLSASPLAKRYGRWAGTLPDNAPERVSVPSASTRRVMLHTDPRDTA
ncbi:MULTISPECIES: cation:proton antiporter domain-containing protein [Nocardia]|uniref:cation:proton antiporter domain-containing protein n=1 Tax=Nocardia TaxID=1817 RepID=UPI000D68C680|nr:MULTISPECIES: cation:proton antiporter [Nocardia]